jgi:hypothetical protein
MTAPSSELYDIIMDTIDANEELTVCEVIYVIERVKHELMQGVDRTEKEEKENEDEK